MPLFRIKRMGKQFASCGIPVYPPVDMLGEPGLKRRCTKLVPGQVIDLPADHNLANQECIEQVRRVQPDEILRPWVFATPDEAMAANPNKSKLTHSQIVDGLAMAEGAISNADKNREKTRAIRDAEEGEELEIEELESEARIARRAQNRQRQDVYEDAKPVAETRSRGSRPVDEPEETEEAPRRSRRRARAGA